MNHRMKAELIWSDRGDYIIDERDVVWYLDEYAGYYPLTEYDYNSIYAELVELLNQQRRASLKRRSMEKAAEDFGPIASLWNGRAKAAYRRGWRASQNDDWGNTLEKADLDGRTDCDYWYSGYMDSSTGRDMWELVADDGSMYVKDGHTCSYCKA